MISKTDLPILIHLHKELLEPQNNLGISFENLPTKFKDKFIINKSEEEYNQLELEFRKFANIFERYNVGEYFDNNTGCVIIRPNSNTYGINFASLFEDEQNEKKRGNIELQEKIANLKLNSWLLRTKWLPHIISIISILFAVYVFYNTKKDNNQLLEKIQNLEQKIKPKTK